MGRPTILLADDDPSIRKLLKIFFTREKIDVIAAENGAQACELYQAAQDRIDLVLLDVCMPEKTGIEALQSIRAIDPDVPICFFSSIAEAPDECEKLRDMGATQVFRKPMSLAELGRSLRDLLT